jgi:5-methylcytosine-specific restriction protein A
MPTRPLRACANAPRCTGLTRGRYCAACDARNGANAARRRHDDSYEQKRASSAARGYDRKWRKARLGFLRAHPLCADPFGFHDGRAVPATVVDHVRAHKGDRRLFWDRRNWQALCASCHSYKSSVEPGGRAHRRERWEALDSRAERGPVDSAATHLAGIPRKAKGAGRGPHADETSGRNVRAERLSGGGGVEISGGPGAVTALPTQARVLQVPQSGEEIPESPYRPDDSADSPYRSDDPSGKDSHG